MWSQLAGRSAVRSHPVTITTSGRIILDTDLAPYCDSDTTPAIVLLHISTRLPLFDAPPWPPMARPQNRKRQRADEQGHVPSKKTKQSDLSYRASNFSPDFYDNLSSIHLTSRALRELDRRNDQQPRPEPLASQARISNLWILAKPDPHLARFARFGGPNLRDLRGCQVPTSVTDAMASTPSSATSRPTQSTKPTTASSKSRRSSAYDANFEQHLIDHNIFPPLHRLPDGRRAPKPINIEEILRVLKVPRGSLSPSAVSETAFEDFQLKNTTKSEGTVMRNVVPIIAGEADISNEGHLPFVNLNSITGNTTVNPVPDFFDGAQSGSVDKQVREDLNNIIIPTKHAYVPVAPNFFLEAKGSTGTGDVARGQAVLDGAYGACMMHALQNYLKEEPVYDGNAYTFSSTLLDGTLKLYAHYMTAPAGPELRPQYHTTQLKAYALTGDRDVWLEGTGALRNLRKLAKDYRDRFIESANVKARRRRLDVVTELDGARAEEGPQEGGSSPLEFFDCQIFAEPSADDQEPDHKVEETQQTQEANTGLGIIHHVHDDERDPDFSQADTEVSGSFTTSFPRVSQQNSVRLTECSLNHHVARPPLRLFDFLSVYPSRGTIDKQRHVPAASKLYLDYANL